MNGATLIVKMLEAYGVKVVFGVPGETSIRLYQALAADDCSIEHVMARDERSAGCMADAYARVTHRPGVVEFPSGAGPLYGLAAVAEANESGVPMIAITSDNSLAVEGRGFIAELDCQRLFQPVTKASVMPKSARKIPETIRNAFRIATTGRAGAVHIAVPDNLYVEEVDPDEVSLHVETACISAPAFPSGPASDKLLEFRDALAGAARPLVVAGGGVNRAAGRDALTEFAELYQVPVVTSITGQQAISDTHELSVGIIGDNGFHPHANRALEESDLLVYVGCRMGSVTTIGWTFPAPKPERKIVHVDVDPEVLGRNSIGALNIVSDAAEFFRHLIALGPMSSSNADSNWIPTLNLWRKRFWDHASSPTSVEKGAATLNPQAVIQALSRRVTEPQLVFVDPGTSTPYSCRYLTLSDERSKIIMNRSYGGLGWAIPGVIAGWYADSTNRPIGLFGDGSLGMSVGELETVVRLGIPAILLLFNNRTFGWIDAHTTVVQGLEAEPLQFGQSDCVGLAAAYGFHGLRVQRIEDLDAALDEAFAHEGPVFIDVHVQTVAEEIPPVYTWIKRKGLDPLTVGGEKLEIGSIAVDLQTRADHTDNEGR